MLLVCLGMSLRALSPWHRLSHPPPQAQLLPIVPYRLNMLVARIRRRLRAIFNALGTTNRYYVEFSFIPIGSALQGPTLTSCTRRASASCCSCH